MIIIIWMIIITVINANKNKSGVNNNWFKYLNENAGGHLNEAWNNVIFECRDKKNCLHVLIKK